MRIAPGVRNSRLDTPCHAPKRIRKQESECLPSVGQSSSWRRLRIGEVAMMTTPESRSGVSRISQSAPSDRVRESTFGRAVVLLSEYACSIDRDLLAALSDIAKDSPFHH